MQSILERAGGSLNQCWETCRLRRHHPRPQIGNATIGRQEVGILGILHLSEHSWKKKLSDRTIFGWPGEKLPDNRRERGRQNTHSHDTCVHAQVIRTLSAQMFHSPREHAWFKANTAQGLRIGVLKNSLSPSVMSHLLCHLLTEHFYTISLTYLTCLPTFFSLTVLSWGTGSRNPARFTAEWRTN